MSHHIGGQVVYVYADGVGGSDLQGHIVHGFLVAFLIELSDNADTAAQMDVGIHSAFQTDKAADADLFADAGHGGIEHGFHGLITDLGGHELFYGSGVGFHHLLGHGLYEVLELVGLGHKVGLAVDFHDSGGILSPVIGHDALGGNTAGLLGGGGQTLLTEEVDRLFHIALALGESLLAIHHAGTSALTQCGYILSGKSCHGNSSYCIYSSTGASSAASTVASTAASVICSPCLPSRTASAILAVIRRTARIASSLAGMG